MDFERVDHIEKEWLALGKKREIDYIWLAHGKYVRENPDFKMETPDVNTPAPLEGTPEARDAVGRFYNDYILKEEDTISADRCCITGGCRDGMNAALRYFESIDDRNVLYLVPTFKPLIDIGEGIFDQSRIFFLRHFNEPWDVTFRNIEVTCDKNRIGCIVLANPNNPAGIMYPDAFLTELGTLSNDRKIMVIEDGAYFLHYDRNKQTTILNHSKYAVSLITSLKLLLGKHKVGGAVLTETYDLGKFAELARHVPGSHQLWFAMLLCKVALETPSTLHRHLDGMFSMSEKITAIFTQAGFVPVYAAYHGNSAETSIGPVITFTYKNRNGDSVSPEMLFDALKNQLILTTPLSDGIRINSRSIAEVGVALLEEKMGAINKALEKEL